MTKIILLRHGQTQSNVELIYQGHGNSQLTKKGKQQAKALAKFLKEEEISAIYCSDLDRAYNTAKYVAKKHELKPIKIKALRERNYGAWENMRFGELKNKYPKLYALWMKHPNKAKIPGAETLKQLQARVIKTIKKITKKHKGKTVCIVGHGGINRAILFYFMEIPLNNFWRIRQDNACINIISLENVPRISLLNFILDKSLKIRPY